MNEADQVVGYLFLLSLVLIIVAYFTGFVSDVGSVSQATNSLIQTATGRNAQGQFSGYPSGTTAVTTSSTTLLNAPGVIS